MDIMSGNTNGIESWMMHVADFTVHGSAAYALRIIHFAWTRWRRYSIGRKELSLSGLARRRRFRAES